MTIWATSNTVLSDSGETVSKSRTAAIPCGITSLKPGSIYTFLCNGIEMGWACKPFGGNLGDNLISDDFGSLSFIFLYDQQYLHGYALNNVMTVNSYLTLEVRGLDNISTFLYFPTTLRASQ